MQFRSKEGALYETYSALSFYTQVKHFTITRLKIPQHQTHYKSNIYLIKIQIANDWNKIEIIWKIFIALMTPECLLLLL